jgi:hypothetical protein
MHAHRGGHHRWVIRKYDPDHPPVVTARNLGFGERRGEGRGVPERSW